MDNKSIGETIAYLRKKYNMTQSQLGKKLGVSDKNISKWENNINTPDYTIIKDLSNIFNVSVETILNGYDLKDNKNKRNKKIIVSLIVLLISLIIAIFIFFKISSNHNQITYTVKGNNETINFNGYLILSNEKNIITINNFKYLGESYNPFIKEYSFYLKNEEKILYAYYEEIENMSQPNLTLDTIISNINIDMIELSEDNVNLITIEDLKDLSISLEYITNNDEENIINIDLFLEKII